MGTFDAQHGKKIGKHLTTVNTGKPSRDYYLFEKPPTANPYMRGEPRRIDLFEA